MKYKFPQFNAEIVNPTITADPDTISIQPSKNTIGVYIELSTENAKLYGVHLENIPVTNMSYQGYPNLIKRVTSRLQDFEVSE